MNKRTYEYLKSHVRYLYEQTPRYTSPPTDTNHLLIIVVLWVFLHSVVGCSVEFSSTLSPPQQTKQEYQVTTKLLSQISCQCPYRNTDDVLLNERYCTLLEGGRNGREIYTYSYTHTVQNTEGLMTAYIYIDWRQYLFTWEERVWDEGVLGRNTAGYDKGESELQRGRIRWKGEGNNIWWLCHSEGDNERRDKCREKREKCPIKCMVYDEDR